MSEAMRRGLPHLAARIFGTPLLIGRERLDVILSVLGPRLGAADGPLPEAPPDVGAPRPPVSGLPEGAVVIPVHGTLVQRSSWLDAPSGLLGYDAVREAFGGAVADPSVRLILLDVDSPGGETAGLFDLADEIYAARGAKPVVAFVNEAALSAAYALASAAEWVFLPRTGMVGSVGVIALHLDQSGLDEKAGLRYEAVYAGARKNDFSPHEPLSDAARGELRRMVDETYELLVSTVARNRGLRPEAVRATEAEILRGAEAVSAGFADGVRSMGTLVREVSARLSSAGVLAKGGKTMTMEERVEVSAEVRPAAAEASGAVPEAAEAAEGAGAARAVSAREALRERARVMEIMNACGAVRRLIPEGLAEELIAGGVGIEAARERILKEIAARCAEEIVSTVSASGAGGANPLIADAMKRVGRKE